MPESSGSPQAHVFGVSRIVPLKPVAVDVASGIDSRHVLSSAVVSLREFLPDEIMPPIQVVTKTRQ